MGHGDRVGAFLRVSTPIPPGLDGLKWVPARNFLGLDAADAAWETAAAVVLPIPYEATTSWGTKCNTNGPIKTRPMLTV